MSADFQDAVSPPKAQSPPSAPARAPAPPPPPDVEAQAPPPASGGSSGFGMSSVLSRWRRDDLMKKAWLVCRGLSLAFSLLAFLIMVTNEHGDWKNFHRYQEFRYLAAISILATLYTGFQAFKTFSSGPRMFDQRKVDLFEFVGDQLLAYLLISAASTAVPMTNRMRENVDNLFTDALAASITMAFFAFFTLSILAIISGYKLSTQSYI